MRKAIILAFAVLSACGGPKTDTVPVDTTLPEGTQAIAIAADSTGMGDMSAIDNAGDNAAAALDNQGDMLSAAADNAAAAASAPADPAPDLGDAPSSYTDPAATDGGNTDE